jgi:hypothetical protein
MKTNLPLFRKLALFSSALVLSALSLSSCQKEADATDNGNNDNNNNNNGTEVMYTVSGNADGAQMIPAVSGSGTGSISGNYNATTRVLQYNTRWTSLSGAPTMGGFFNGASGTSGTMVGSSWAMGTNLGSSGTYTGQMTLTADQDNQLKAGTWYYSLGTASHNSGEIRGQITATRVP